MRGHPAFAFQRFDQRRFLAADIGTGTETNFNVEIETGFIQNIFAQQSRLRVAAPARIPVVAPDSGTRRAGTRIPCFAPINCAPTSCHRTPDRHGCSAARDP